jgi:hypothetical protein
LAKNKVVVIFGTEPDQLPKRVYAFLVSSEIGPLGFFTGRKHGLLEHVEPNVKDSLEHQSTVDVKRLVLFGECTFFYNNLKCQI